MKRRLFPILGLVLIFGFSGCAGVKNSMRLSEKDSAWNPIKKLSAEKKKEQTDDVAPTSMAAIWSYTEIQRPGEKPMRGFGGRFFFYDQSNNPVRAEGELVVYGYDNSKTEKTDSRADKKFVIRDSEFQSHFSESGLGASYSVWVPWEPAGGDRKAITLVPLFKLANGGVLESGQSINVLRGKIPESEANDVSGDQQMFRSLGSSPALTRDASYRSNGSRQQTSTQDVAQVAYEDQVEGQKSKIRTSSIQLTPSLRARMQSPNLSFPSQRPSVSSPSIDQNRFQSPTLGTPSNPTASAAESSTTEAEEPRPRIQFGVPGSFQ